MEIINNGCRPEDVVLDAGICTEEPEDNCWLHLD